MKMKKMLIAGGVLVSLMSGGQAFGYGFSITPGSGSLEVSSIGQEIVYDLNFTVGSTNAAIGIDGWDLDFFFDSNELALKTITTKGWSGTTTKNHIESSLTGFESFTGGEINGSTLSYEAGSLSGGYGFEANTTTKMASFHFKALSLTPFDGAADFTLLSQLGTTGANLKGMINTLSGDKYQYASASGADVGTSAVPIPAAAWLLGSGLLGLMGIRRKRS